MDKYILDAAGNPVRCADVVEWGRWFETADRQVASSDIGTVQVSTVFLALDHNWGQGPPLLWETMIFGGAHDGFQERYSTRAEAIDGHARAVKLAAAGC